MTKKNTLLELFEEKGGYSTIFTSHMWQDIMVPALCVNKCWYSLPWGDGSLGRLTHFIIITKVGWLAGGFKLRTLTDTSSTRLCYFNVNDISKRGTYLAYQRIVVYTHWNRMIKADLSVVVILPHQYKVERTNFPVTWCPTDGTTCVKGTRL